MKKDYAQLTKLEALLQRDYFNQILNYLCFVVIFYEMEVAINPYKTIQKAKVKSLLASQGIYIIY